MPPGKRRAPVPAPKFARLPPEGGLRLRGARGTMRALRAAAVAPRPCPAPALHWRPIPQSGERAMAKTRGTGLLMVWTDIDARHEAEFNRWYEEEHIARLLQVPGFLSAGRYRALKGGPKYLAIYELEDHAVLRSAAYLDAVRYRPSPQRQRVGAGHAGRNFLRNGYRQIFPVHTHPVEQTRGPAPVLQMGRIDVPAAVEEEFNDWYNTVYIPGYLAVPGCLTARRYVAVE